MICLKSGTPFYCSDCPTSADRPIFIPSLGDTQKLSLSRPFGPILPNKYSCLSGFLPAGLGRNPLRPAWPPVKSIHSTLEIPPQQILRANMLMPRSPSPYPTEDLNAPDSRTVVLSSAKEWALACVNSPPATKTRDHET